MAHNFRCVCLHSKFVFNRSLYSTQSSREAGWSFSMNFVWILWTTGLWYLEPIGNDRISIFCDAPSFGNPKTNQRVFSKDFFEQFFWVEFFPDICLVLGPDDQYDRSWNQWHQCQATDPRWWTAISRFCLSLSFHFACPDRSAHDSHERQQRPDKDDHQPLLIASP